MPALSELVDLVFPHVRNCPTPLIEGAIRDAARRFCQHTRYHRETLIIDLVGGTLWYPLIPVNPEEEVGGIRAAQYLDRELVPSAPEEILASAGCPHSFWFLPSRHIVLSPTPPDDEDEALIVNVFKLPKRGATTLSEQLVMDSEEILKDGALGELLMMPGAWQDTQRAVMHEQRFKQAKDDRRASADMQHRPFNNYTLAGF